MFRSLRNAFITGVIVILPLGVTMMVINVLLDTLGTPASKFFFWFLDPNYAPFRRFSSHSKSSQF